MPLISVISPVYLAEDIIDELVRRLIESLSTITDKFEIILVEDGSPDHSWESIERNCILDKRVKGIKLSRNFGQHFALSAGLKMSKGDYIILMDCDLQDQPEDIPVLFSAIQNQHDIILGRRVIRQDRRLKKLFSFLYYKIFRILVGKEFDPSVGTFRIMTKQVCEALCRMDERQRLLGAMISWLGFDVGYVVVRHAQRYSGESSYSFNKALKLGLDGIFSFSEKPLKFGLILGVMLVFLSSIFIVYKVTLSLLSGSTAIGWSSLIATIIFSTGIISSLIGLVGVYVGKIFEEVKKRPLYIFHKTINFKDI